ncbi:MAG: hypothetical protein HUK02_05555 [Bacteroidaceae bacterium]|nr:hypothetical protein [Bacteroidaceae bacterium]
MKKIYASMLVILLGTSLWAQRMDITLRDHSVISYDVSGVEEINFYPAGAPGELFGRWYLGYRVLNNTTTHYDGTEVLDFRGTTLTWTKTTGETNYQLVYDEDNRSFSGIYFNSSGEERTAKFTIVAIEDELLVLKYGSFVYYFYKSPEAAHNAEMETFPARTEYDDIEKILKLKGGVSNSTVTPMGKHFENRHVTTDSDRAWLANAANQPTWLPDNFTKWGAKPVNLYPFDSPQPADVNQHAIGDCCLCAVLASMAYLYPDFIQNIIHANGTNYTIDMYDPQGQPVQVAVDNKILLDDNGNVVQLTGKNNAITWATILEKALMKWESVYECNGIGGIGTEHAAPPFTGCGDSFSFSPGTLFNLEMQKVVDWAMQNGMISIGGFNQGDLLCGTLNSITGHAFTLMYTAQPDLYLWSMRNPWGITAVDGVLEIPNRRSIVKTIDFRLVSPGAAAPYLRADLGGYRPPKWLPRHDDLGISQSLLRQYGLTSYGPATGTEYDME